MPTQSYKPKIPADESPPASLAEESEPLSLLSFYAENSSPIIKKSILHELQAGWIYHSGKFRLFYAGPQGFHTSYELHFQDERNHACLRNASDLQDPNCLDSSAWDYLVAHRLVTIEIDIHVPEE